MKKFQLKNSNTVNVTFDWIKIENYDKPESEKYNQDARAAKV